MKYLSVSVLAFAFALGGCGTTSTLTPSSLTTNLTTIEQNIIGFARSLCGFQPTISTVESIINALYPAAAIATVPAQAVAQTICNAVPPATTVAAGRLGAAAIVYPGTNIVIHGTYISRLGRRHR